MASALPGAPVAPQRPQYHHYIPRFILRNYVDPAQQPTPNTGNKKKDKKKLQQMQRKRDFLLNILNLQGTMLEQQPISRTFGVMDMYRDFDTSNPDQHRLEKELSKLESRAGETIAKVRTAFDSGKHEVELLRGEKDDLRKFLFIMLYRNTTFQKRFNITIEEYEENDRAQMLAFMKDKNFTRPIDVWFTNIKAILDLKIDVDGSWCGKIMSQAYPLDARWFINYMQMSFLTFCTPQNSLDGIPLNPECI